MKWLKRILLTLVSLVALLVIVGMMLPSGFKVQRSITVAAPAEKIYALLADPREWKRWAIWNQRDPAMQIQYSGAAQGTGAKWSWQSKTEGNGAMEFTAAVPYKHVDYALSFPDRRHVVARDPAARARRQRHARHVDERGRHGQQSDQPLFRADDGFNGGTGFRRRIAQPEGTGRTRLMRHALPAAVRPGADRGAR